MTGLTTAALLAAESRRTGFTQVQLLQIAAKSALIRHLASEPAGENFVCKGGTALHHVYGSARFSIVDADFTHREPKTVEEAALNTALTVDDQEFSIDFSSVRWDTANDVWSAKHVGYKIDGVPVNAPGVDMSVSVSVQRGEWLDPQPRRIYTDALLATTSTFPVNVLTLEELAAEKILGWCSKQLPKHAVDLAWIARDHPGLDGPKTRELLEQKFAIEGKTVRYQTIGIVSFDALVAGLTGDAALRELRVQFPRSELLLPTAERTRATQSLRDVETVVALLKSFWVPIVRRQRRA